MDVRLNCPSGCETIHHKLKCGADVFILPKDRNIKVGAVAVGFGSADLSFFFEGKSYDVPQGTAHFLEHKMFDRPEGDISEKFAELGAEVNAFTDNEKTVYYFKTAANFMDCFRLLLNFVESIGFKEAESEKSIIGSEIDMYDDYYDRKAFFGALNELYPSSLLACEIAGTRKSIENIDTDTLYLCHDAFYVPENMTVICVGDVVADEIMSETEKIFYGREKQKAKKYKISSVCSGGEREIEADTEVQMFCIAYPVEKVFSGTKTNMLLKIIGDAAFGECSEIFMELIHQAAVFDVLTVDAYEHNGQGYIAVSGKSGDAKKAMDIINSGFIKFRNNKIDTRTFYREKKRTLGSFIRLVDDCETAMNIQAAYNEKSLAETAEEIHFLSLSECNEVLGKIGLKNGRCIVKKNM